MSRTFSFSKASLTGLVALWTGTTGLDSLESDIAIIGSKGEAVLLVLETVQLIPKITYYLQQTVVKEWNSRVG